MTPNTNQETGLPYGVIGARSLNDELFLELLDKARDTVYDALREADKKQVLRTLSDALPGDLSVGHPTIEECLDEIAETVVELRSDRGMYEQDEPTAEFEHDEVTVHFSWLGGAPLITSIDGPKTSVRSWCSPCVPGAADLNSGYGRIDCHGLPMDWYTEEAWALLTSVENG